jgi:hypothetical protein
MRILPLILPALLFMFAHVTRQTDSPHGDDFKIPCNKCHSAKGWELDMEVYSYDHNTSNMPLVGQHTQVKCRQCHISLVFSEAETECYQCHTDVHEQTVGNDCGRCHTPHSWIVNNITDIHRQGRFPLLGAHLMADCNSCHKSASSLRFEPLGVECVDCHLADYQATTQPNHVEGNLGTECADCHNINAFTWSGAGFSHQFFPLTAGHDIQDCSRCHTNGDFTGTPTECYACHQDDYLSTTNPAHQAAGFSTDCILCHTTRPGWKPAIFDHSSFPLTEGHADVDCAQCHDPNDYSNISTECYSCHQDDYTGTTNPNHVSAGISTNCLECHTTLPGWKPADFPIHDGQFFPIYSGSHRGTWDNCAQCHEDPNNYASFTCLTCHEHSQSRMDDVHSEEADYSYNSVACLDCHPTGRAED